MKLGRQLFTVIQERFWRDREDGTVAREDQDHSNDDNKGQVLSVEVLLVIHLLVIAIYLVQYVPGTKRQQ
jgi:Ca2+/H+ antiporter